LADFEYSVQEVALKIEKVEHIGIAVKNIDETLKFYTGVMGIKSADIQMGGNPAVMKMATINTAGAKLEFLQRLDPKSAVNIDVIDHVAIKVDNIEETLSAVKKDGGTLIHEKPMQFGGKKIAFALPKNSQVMIEFMEG
jgi:methylmalonyl-CoA/ethylmalonyl-CoA epimerase